MNSVPIYIEGHAKVTDVYGYWPQFHDSPVHSFTATDSQINLRVQVWDMTSETDERGLYILKNHHLVHFRFDEPSELAIKNSEMGNILFGLEFSTLEELHEQGSFQVKIDSVMGLDYLSSKARYRPQCLTL